MICESLGLSDCHHSKSYIIRQLFLPSVDAQKVNTIRHMKDFSNMAIPIFDLDMEWRQLTEVLDNDATPFRVDMIANGWRLGERAGNAAINAATSISQSPRLRRISRPR